MRALRILRSAVGTGRFISRGRYISTTGFASEDDATAASASLPNDGTLPTQARAVIIGGGVIGASVAYNLTKMGWDDGEHSNPPELGSLPWA